MKGKILVCVFTVAILLTLFCIPPITDAKMRLREGPANPPVIIEVASWGGGGVIILYYPDEELVCFMNESGSGCIEVEEFSPSYQNLVKKKAQAAKN